MCSINDLPNEVLEKIILHLLPSHRDIQNCQELCQRWAVLVEHVRGKKAKFFQKAIDNGTLCWQTCDPDVRIATSLRQSHSVATYKDKMYVFGGQCKNLVVFDDIWAFNILEKTWEECISRGARPTPRYRATMVAHEDRLILFGGLCQTHNFNDLYVYKIQEGQWINPEISSPWPPIMSGHTATVHGRQMVVFGGHQCFLGRHRRLEYRENYLRNLH